MIDKIIEPVDVLMATCICRAQMSHMPTWFRGPTCKTIPLHAIIASSVRALEGHIYGSTTSLTHLIVGLENQPMYVMKKRLHLIVCV